MGVLDKQDYKSWVSTMVKKLGEGTKIVLHGISYGATTVTSLASETLPNVKCIIAEGGYSNLEEIISYKLNNKNNLPAFPSVNAMDIVSKMKQNYNISNVDMIKNVSNSNIPILYIHSSGDDFIPEYMAYKLFENTSSEKDLWIVDGNKHNKIFIENNEEYKTKIEEFYGPKLEG